ncbi:hypothetical protein QYM36_011841, partial [Artemia franciscana]
PGPKTEAQLATDQERASKAFNKWFEKYKESTKDVTIAKKAANPPMGFIYIGLAVAAIGIIISFVGLGDRSFRTEELRLIGPLMTALGFAIIFIRSVLCCVVHWTNSKFEQENVIPEVIVHQHLQPQELKFKPRLRKISSDDELEHFSIPMSNESLMYHGLVRSDGEPLSLDYEAVTKRRELILDPNGINNRNSIMVPNGIPSPP